MIWFQTWTGLAFDFEDVIPENVVLADVAHSLALQCRFNGHVREFYSVAQHSVIVSEIVPRELARFGLLHDAAETFTGDLVKPVKDVLRQRYGDRGFQLLERKIRVAILIRFGVPFPAPDELATVKAADRVALATERRDLMSPPAQTWESIEDVEPLARRIIPWQWEEAQVRFLERFAEIQPS